MIFIYCITGYEKTPYLTDFKVLYGAGESETETAAKGIAVEGFQAKYPGVVIDCISVTPFPELMLKPVEKEVENV